MIHFLLLPVAVLNFIFTKRPMRQLFVILILVSLCSACDNSDGGIINIPSRVPNKDTYFWNGDDKIELQIDSSMWHILLTEESYNRIQNARIKRGEKALAPVTTIDKEYFSFGIGNNKSVMTDQVKRYYGIIETFIMRDELLPTDEYIYKGCVYIGKGEPSSECPNYTATSLRVSVVVPTTCSVDEVKELLFPYNVLICSIGEYYDNTMVYEVFCVNDYHGHSVQTVVNEMIESGQFIHVYSYSVVE